MRFVGFVLLGVLVLFTMPVWSLIGAFYYLGRLAWGVLRVR